jgi:hypothetical protein
MGEWLYRSTFFLTSAIAGSEWSSSCPNCFTPRERAPGTQWLGGWVGPRAGLGNMEKSFPPPLLVRLLALRPLLAYCASLGWRWLWRSRWNVDWQGKLKFSEKTCLSATFVHHKIPHDQTRVWTWAAAVGKILDLTGTRTQPLGHPACSHSLYQLHYPSSFHVQVHLLLLVCLLSSLFDTEDGGSMFVQNSSELLPDCMVSHLSR